MIWIPLHALAGTGLLFSIGLGLGQASCHGIGMLIISSAMNDAQMIGGTGVGVGACGIVLEGPGLSFKENNGLG